MSDNDDDELSWDKFNVWQKIYLVFTVPFWIYFSLTRYDSSWAWWEIYIEDPIYGFGFLFVFGLFILLGKIKNK